MPTGFLFQLILIGLLERNQVALQSLMVRLLLLVLVHQFAHLAVVVLLELLYRRIVIGFELASVCIF